MYMFPDKSLLAWKRHSQFYDIWFTVKLTKPWTPEIFMKCYCVAGNSPIRREINRKLQRQLVCGFEVSLRILNFIVIGQYTINIPEIFQVFTVFGAC